MLPKVTQHSNWHSWHWSSCLLPTAQAAPPTPGSLQPAVKQARLLPLQRGRVVALLLALALAPDWWTSTVLFLLFLIAGF